MYEHAAEQTLQEENADIRKHLDVVVDILSFLLPSFCCCRRRSSVVVAAASAALAGLLFRLLADFRFSF